MWETFTNLIVRYPLDFISQLFALLPIIVGFVRYSRLTASMKWVVILFLFYFLKDSVAWIYSSKHTSNQYLYNLISFPEIVVVAIIYALSMPRKAKQISWFAFFCALVNIFFYSDREISAGNLTIARLFIIVTVLMYLTHVLNEALIRNILKHDLFWVSSGLLIYAAGTFFIFLFEEELFKANPSSKQTFDFYWSFQEIIFIVFCIVATLGLNYSTLRNELNLVRES